MSRSERIYPNISASLAVFAILCFSMSTYVEVLASRRGLPPLQTSERQTLAEYGGYRQPPDFVPNIYSPGRYEGRSLRQASSSSTYSIETGASENLCTFRPDTASYCEGAEHLLCSSQDSTSEHFKRACQTTCKICQVRF